MRKVLKFVKGKRDDKKEHASTSLGPFSMEPSYHSPGTPGDEDRYMPLDQGCGYIVDISGKDKSFTKLHKAAWQGNLDKLKSNLKKIDIDTADRLNRTPLHLAAARGYTNLVWFLISNKAKMTMCDNDGKTAFLKAIDCGHKDIVQLMLEKGVDLTTVDYSGNSGLHIATKQGYYEISSILLKEGANFETSNTQGEFPLHIATCGEHKDLVELLIRYGSSVNIVDRENRSPLMFAAKNGNMPLVQLFLDNGAQRRVMDSKDWTAEDYAIQSNHLDIAAELKSPSDVVQLQSKDLSLPADAVSLARRSISPAANHRDSRKSEDPDSDTWSSHPSDAASKPVIPLGMRLMNYAPQSDDEISEESIHSPRVDAKDSEGTQDSPRSCVIPPPCQPPRSWDLIQSGVIDVDNEPRRRSLLTLGTLRSKRESFTESPNAESPSFHSENPQIGQGDAAQWLMSHSFSKQEGLAQHRTSFDSLHRPTTSKVPSLEIEGKMMTLNDGGGEFVPDVRVMRLTNDLSDSDSDWDSDSSLPIDSLPVRIVSSAVIDSNGGATGVEAVQDSVPLPSSTVVSEKKVRQLLRVPPIDLTDEDVELGKEMERETKSDSSEGDRKTQGSSTAGTLGREGTLQGYDEVWVANKSLTDNADAKSDNLVVEDELLFLSPQLAEKSWDEDSLEVPLPPKMVESKLKTSTSLDFKKQTLATFLESKNNNLKYESHSLDNLDDSDGQPQRPKRHLRQMSVSTQPWKSEDLWQKPALPPPPPVNLDRMLADNKRINAQLECYDEALRELAQVKIIKKSSEAQLPRFSNTRNQRYLSLPRTNELIDEAFKEMGQSSVSSMQRGSLSLPRTVTAKDMIGDLERTETNASRGTSSLPRTATPADMIEGSGPVPPPRRRRSLRSRRRTESEGESSKAARDFSRRPLSLDAKHLFEPSKLLIGDENSSPNSSTPPSSIRRTSLEKPIRKKRKTLLAMRGLNHESLNNSQSSIASVEESFDEPPFDQSDGTLPRQSTVIERLDFRPSLSNLSHSDSPASHDLREEEEMDFPMPPPEAFSTLLEDGTEGHSQLSAMLNGAKEDMDGSPPVQLLPAFDSEYKSNQDDAKVDRSDSPEIHRYSPSDESCMSQNEVTPQHSYTLKGHHALLKQHLRTTTAEKGRLEETAAELGEKTEKLKYELADAREASRSRDEVISHLQGQLAQLETKYTQCLEEVQGYRLRLVNQEQELRHLKDLCHQYDEEKESLCEAIRAREDECQSARDSADEDKVSEVTSQLREKEEKHLEMTLRLEQLEDERQKSLDDIAKLEVKNRELQEKLDRSVGKIQILNEELKPAVDLSALQEDARKWKELYESCIVRLEQLVSTSDETRAKIDSKSCQLADAEVFRDELREIIQKLEELKEKDYSSWQSKIQDEVTEAVMLLRSEYSKVENVITKHNDQLEHLVQKLQLDLDNSSLRQACLETQLGKTRDELLEARRSSQELETSAVIEELRRVNVELREQAEQVRSQIEIRDEDLKRKLESLNDLHQSESNFKETLTALDDLKMEYCRLRESFNELIAEKNCTDSKLASMMMLVEQVEELKLQLEETKKIKDGTELANEQVVVLETQLEELKIKLTESNMKLESITSLQFTSQGSQTEIQSEELINETESLRCQLEELTILFGKQEDELKRTLMILHETQRRNTAKAVSVQENVELRKELDVMREELQKCNDELFESKNYILRMSYSKLNEASRLSAAQRGASNKKTPQKPVGSYLQAIDDGDEDEDDDLSMNINETNITEAKDSTQPTDLQKNTLHENYPGRSGNGSGRLNTDESRANCNVRLPALVDSSNQTMQVQSQSTITLASFKPMASSSSSNSMDLFGRQSSMQFYSDTAQPYRYDVQTNTNVPAVKPEGSQDTDLLKYELQMERDNLRKNEEVVEKLKQEIQYLKSNVEKTVRAEEGHSSPERYTSDMADFRRKVSDLEQKVRDENSKRFSLEVQVNKMRYDLQEKLQLEKELCILRGRLETDFVSRYELEQLRKTYEMALSRAQQEADKTARNELNNKLGQINTFMEKKQDEDELQRNQLPRLATEGMSSTHHEFQEARLKLRSELDNCQAIGRARREEEREKRLKREKQERENEEQREVQRKKLIEKSYNINLAAPSNIKEKEILPKKVCMPACNPLRVPPVFCIPAPPAENPYTAILRKELDKSIQKNTQDSGIEEATTSRPQTASEEQIDIFKKKYFLH